ncbi:thioesterase II family protein [Streptomyces sp. NPDC057877]|uniref:thioesterase II family protein n=1 Tax=Streptomyces sp. NPDC057877 TaxID=3346269 RepID=UPI0036BEF60B
MSDEPPVRLHCFARSGEGVSVFDGWAARVGPGVEPVPVRVPPSTAPHPVHPVHPAGPVSRAEPLLAQVLPRITAARGGCFVLYGHGLGAMIALTVTRALHEAGLPGPALLAVGACPPPRALPDARRATDAELLHLFAGATVPPASDEGIFLRAMLPVLRADLQLAQDLTEKARAPLAPGPLTTPVLVIAAPRGPLAGPAASGWRQVTRGPVRSRTVPGHHVFARGGGELPRLLGRACRVARRLTPQPAPIG